MTSVSIVVTGIVAILLGQGAWRLRQTTDPTTGLVTGTLVLPASDSRSWVRVQCGESQSYSVSVTVPKRIALIEPVAIHLRFERHAGTDVALSELDLAVIPARRSKRHVTYTLSVPAGSQGIGAKKESEAARQFLRQLRVSHRLAYSFSRDQRHVHNEGTFDLAGFAMMESTAGWTCGKFPLDRD